MIENKTRLIQHTLQNILKVLQKESANVSNLVFRTNLKSVINTGCTYTLRDYCKDFLNICLDIESSKEIE